MVRTSMKALAFASLLAAPALARVAHPQRAEAGLAVRDGGNGTETDVGDQPACEYDCDDNQSCYGSDCGEEDHHSCYGSECGEPTPEPTPKPTAAWGNYGDHCNPSYDVYECEKDDGSWEYTTLTVYPTDCPSYHEPTPLPEWEGWKHYDPSHPHPKPTQWEGTHDDGHYGKPPAGYYEWDPSWGPKPATWDDWKHAPATTWSAYDPKPTEWNSWHPEPPKGWYEWDWSKGPKPAHWDDWKYVKVSTTWNEWDPKPTDWSPYAHPPAGWYEWDDSKGPKPEHWDDWKYVTVVVGDDYDWENYGKDVVWGEKDGVKYIIITIIEVYKVPSKDGWVDKTTTLYTTHCGCKETPIPKKPEYVTVTTVCPDEWNVKDKTVTYVTPTCTWTPEPASTWLNYGIKTPVADASTWATYKTPVADSSSTWATYEVKTPVADASTTWATAAIKTPAVASSTQWAGVQKWQGAASSVVISKVMVGGAGMVAALAYFL